MIVDVAESDEKQTFMEELEGLIVSQKLALISSELGEALEAWSKGRHGLEEKNTFEDEIADVFIHLSDLCGYLGIDLDKQVEWKYAYNLTRPHKHGKAF